MTRRARWRAGTRRGSRVPRAPRGAGEDRGLAGAAVTSSQASPRRGARSTPSVNAALGGGSAPYRSATARRDDAASRTSGSWRRARAGLVRPTCPFVPRPSTARSTPRAATASWAAAASAASSASTAIGWNAPGGAGRRSSSSRRSRASHGPGGRAAGRRTRRGGSPRPRRTTRCPRAPCAPGGRRPATACRPWAARAGAGAARRADRQLGGDEVGPRRRRHDVEEQGHPPRRPGRRNRRSSGPSG